MIASPRAICSEQVLLAGAFLSMSVAHEQFAHYIMCALDKNLGAQANYSEAFPLMLHAVVFSVCCEHL